jgi:hypothetical protein
MFSKGQCLVQKGIECSLKEFISKLRLFRRAHSLEAAFSARKAKLLGMK